MYKSLRPFELLEQLNGWPVTREIYLSQLWRLGSPPRSRCWQMWCVVRAHFWFTVFFYFVLIWQKGKGNFLGPPL